MTDPNLDHIHESLRHMAVPIADLTYDPKNARKHDRRNLDAIKSSLEKFGFRQPIVVQRQGMVIRAGNGRTTVSEELGWTHVPAIVVDEAEADAIAYAIADNRTAELAEWDWENLTDILKNTDTDWSGLNLFEDAELSLLTQSEWTPPTVDDDAEFGGTDEGKGKTEDQPKSDALIITLTGSVAAAVRRLADEQERDPSLIVSEKLAGFE